jgi:hypothetical protein
MNFAKQFNYFLTYSAYSNDKLGSSLDIEGVNRTFIGDTVEYSYTLKVYNATAVNVTIHSNITVHSSSSCSAIIVNESEVFHWVDNSKTIFGG